jgi:membrane protein YdbS with pleckstrin-like domain
MLGYCRSGPGTLALVPISTRVLADDEDVLVDVHLHWIYFSGPAVMTAVAVGVAVAVVVSVPNAPIFVAWILGAMVAVPALWLAGRVLKWLGISLIVTTTRVIYRQGIFGRDIVQLRLQRVTEVHCTQTMFDRLLGSGRMVIEVEGDGPMAIDDVRRPAALQRVITRQLDSFQSSVPTYRPPGDLPGRLPTAEDFGTRERGGRAGGEVPDTTPPRGVPRSDPGEQPVAPGRMHDPQPTRWESDGEVGQSMHAATPAGRVTMSSLSEQLVALEDLRRRGILTDEEFTAKKGELLGRI